MHEDSFMLHTGEGGRYKWASGVIKCMLSVFCSAFYIVQGIKIAKKRCLFLSISMQYLLEFVNDTVNCLFYYVTVYLPSHYVKHATSKHSILAISPFYIGLILKNKSHFVS